MLATHTKMNKNPDKAHKRYQYYISKLLNVNILKIKLKGYLWHFRLPLTLFTMPTAQLITKALSEFKFLLWQCSFVMY